jgi:KaiC/GvpD/RAD55 family RecA-like ATPase
MPEFAASPLLEAALAYAARGWPVFPLHTPRAGICDCRRADCKSIGKHPRTTKGLSDATTEPEKIRQWWSMWPDANIGLVTGSVPGFIAVDIDPRHGGGESLAEFPGNIPGTLESVTGGGGRHILLLHPGGTIRNGANVLGPGIDIRGDGGYIVAPPSVHASGGCYRWEDPTAEMAACPAWLLAMLTRRPQVVSAEEAAGPIIEGRRNAKLASDAGSMRRRGFTASAIRAALLVTNAERCIPPLEEEEIDRIATSVARYQPAEQEPPPPEQRSSDTDSLSVAALLPNYLRELMHGVPRLATHFKELDKALNGGLPLRGLTVLGGEPKAGKSSIAQRIAIEHCRHGGIALYYDFENGTARFLRRMVCAEAKIGPGRLQQMNPDEQIRFEDACRTVMGPMKELYIQTDRRTTPADLERDVVEYLVKAGDRPLLVVVDSLQKLSIPDLSERRSAIDTWLRMLEGLKNQHNIAILAVSELKRPQNGTGYETGGTAFKESGDIEYTADLALTLELEDRTEATEGDVEPSSQPAEGPWCLLRVQYDREGRTGRVARYRAVFPFYGVQEGSLVPKPTICIGPECDRPVEKGGLCYGHRKQKNRGQPLVPLSPKVSPRASGGQGGQVFSSGYTRPLGEEHE